MPLRQLHAADTFVFQRSGGPAQVPLIYLPGVHGCWTPLDKARATFNEHCELIEIAYPFFDDWSLEHYADALLHLAHDLDLESFHLVGESFGSLVGWQFGLSHPSRIRSFTLIGGFSQPPGMYMAASAGMGLSVLPAVAFDKIVDAYVSYKTVKGEPRTVASGTAYPGVRGARGQNATANRMKLIQAADFRKDLPRVSFPVRYIGGSKDRVIPVKREIRTLEEQLSERTAFDHFLIPGAPHAIIASHPIETADKVVHWIEHVEGG